MLIAINQNQFFEAIIKIKEMNCYNSKPVFERNKVTFSEKNKKFLKKRKKYSNMCFFFLRKNEQI